jgi:hypothetical protein
MATQRQKMQAKLYQTIKKELLGRIKDYLQILTNIKPKAKVTGCWRKESNPHSPSSELDFESSVS